MTGTITNSENAEISFIAEGMLAAMVKNLRILGIDCEYDGGYSVADAVNNAIRSSRILLTRRNIPETTKLSVYRVSSDLVQEQLLDIINNFSLDTLVKPFSRCLKCNAVFSPQTANSVIPAEQLPKSVIERDLSVCHCDICQKYFWHGSHIVRMLDRLRQWGIVCLQY